MRCKRSSKRSISETTSAVHKPSLITPCSPPIISTHVYPERVHHGIPARSASEGRCYRPEEGQSHQEGKDQTGQAAAQRQAGRGRKQGRGSEGTGSQGGARSADQPPEGIRSGGQGVAGADCPVGIHEPDRSRQRGCAL